MVSDFLEGFRVLGFDLETTGFNPRQDRVVQFALVGSDSDGSQISMQSLVNPGCRIPIESSNVHGIFDEDVRGASGFGEHLDSICKMIEGSIIVGHNVIAFDWRFLEMECIRIGRGVPSPLALVDTLDLARTLGIPGGHRLGVLCERFGISLERCHSADADAGATLLLFWKFMVNFPEMFAGEARDVLESISHRPE